jgi:hypothetical protein
MEYFLSLAGIRPLPQKLLEIIPGAAKSTSFSKSKYSSLHLRVAE